MLAHVVCTPPPSCRFPWIQYRSSVAFKEDPNSRRYEIAVFMFSVVLWVRTKGCYAPESMITTRSGSGRDSRNWPTEAS